VTRDQQRAVLHLVLAVVVAAGLSLLGLLRHIPFGIGRRLEEAPAGVGLVVLTILVVFLVVMFRTLSGLRGVRAEQRSIEHARERVQAAQRAQGARRWTDPEAGSLPSLLFELGAGRSTSLVAGRLALLREREGARDTERAAFLVSSRSGLDEAGLGNSTMMDHALIWALPVLGFLGTAFAMARTVEGFSAALGGAGDFEVLKDNLLRTVIPHLSQAFDVTLVALTLAIVAFLSLSALERTRRSLVVGADEVALSVIALLPGRPVMTGPAGPSDLDRLSTSMDRAADAIEQLRAVTARLAELQSRPRRITFIEDRIGPADGDHPAGPPLTR
jgi:hypothetical protein